MTNDVVVTLMPASELPAYISKLDTETRAWTERAARGECAWICSSCCCTFQEGMPNECAHENSGCTAIIRRDKQFAMREGNEST